MKIGYSNAYMKIGNIFEITLKPRNNKIPRGILRPKFLFPLDSILSSD